jgi:hypothetical protein
MFAAVCWVITAGKHDNYGCSKVRSQIVGGRTSGTEENCGQAYGTSKHRSSNRRNLGVRDHWYLAGAVLVRKYGFAGSYSSVRRYLAGLEAAHPQASAVLEFAPAGAVQVDFGTGPGITDVYTGEVFCTWIQR